MQFGLETYIF